MRWCYPLLVLCVGLAAAQELPLAEECDPESCQAPACRCSSTNIPGGLEARDTPQFVLLTFDDAVNILNIETYRRILRDRRNINQCPIGTTYFVSHEYTNYQLVNELYNSGQEIALHSISHRTPIEFWRDATPEIIRQEFGDQRIQIAHFANIPIGALHGVRKPFLQMSGNSSLQVMAELGLQYDCSMPTISHVSPGLWPYTLHYASTQDCVIPPCPTASIPGPWVIPMITWRDLVGNPCAMADTCAAAPSLTDEDGWFNFMVTNFERHYMGNRAPFGFFVHEWFIDRHPAVERALFRFMDMLNNLQDTFMVTGHDVVEWVKNPVPVNEYRSRPCKFFTRTFCPATSCGPLRGQHNDMDYWISICNVCPRTYPWVGNPLGQ